MRRRRFLQASAATAAALAAPSIGRAADAKLLKFIPEGDLPVLDPVWTSATNARNHGFMVFDTLYGQNDKYAIEPQMVAGHVIENDGRQWTITLRDGLTFHDGAPVRAQDVVPSITRYSARDAFGQALMAATDELSVVSDKVFRFKLKEPFPLLPNALAKTGAPMPAIMPERFAKTDPYKAVVEMVGSGPYRFKADERVPGAKAVYTKFEGYVPREGGSPTFTAGPKVAHFDRIEWITIPDSQTAASALINGEVDWWQTPVPDLLAQLRKSGKIEVKNVDPAGGIGVLRFNTLYPPFDKPAVRRALFGAVDQDEYMTAAGGTDRSLWKDHVGVFSPDTPMATDVGMEALTGPRDLAKVRADLLAAGYAGEKIVVLGASDYPSTDALAQVAADMLRKVGMNVDFQSIDWGTVVQRRASKQPPDKGGWNIFFTYLNGTGNFDPAGQLGIRGNGKDAWFGWPDMPKMEALRAAWFRAPDLAAQKKICEQLQLEFFQEAPYLPLGAFYQPGAWNKSLSGFRIGFPQFYDVVKA
jgi:peptide/nickel transport system substrate-binding protein